MWLETFARQAAHSTRQEIEIVYSELENKIVQDKDTAKDIKTDLETTDDKLSQAEGNRAQQFVLEKVAKSRIEEAEKERICKLQHSTDAKISFTPDQAMMTYMKCLERIGQVQNQDNQRHYGLYKVKESRSINIQLQEDTDTFYCFGCCLTHDDQLLVTDCNNKKVKLVDLHSMTVVDSCTLDYHPFGVCCVSEGEAAVALSQNKIQFVSTTNKLKPTRQLQMSHFCWGVTYNGSKLYVTDNKQSLYVHDIKGILLNTISLASTENPSFFQSYSRHVALNTNGTKIFVGGGNNGLVCLEGSGHHISTIEESGLKSVDGVCVDGKGSVFIVGEHSDTVLQYTEDGKKIGVMVDDETESENHRCVCYSEKLNILFVVNRMVKMYKLE